MAMTSGACMKATAIRVGGAFENRVEICTDAGLVGAGRRYHRANVRPLTAVDKIMPRLSCAALLRVRSEARAGRHLFPGLTSPEASSAAVPRAAAFYGQA
jgi:hypothetical protein